MVFYSFNYSTNYIFPALWGKASVDKSSPLQPVNRSWSTRHPEVREPSHWISRLLDFFFSAKGVLPLCCYVFQDGPWRDTLVRFSYDPRKDPISRLQVLFLSSPSKTIYWRPLLSYQRLYFRNANHPMSRPSVTTRRHERSAINEHQRTQETERKWALASGNDFWISVFTLA